MGTTKQSVPVTREVDAVDIVPRRIEGVAKVTGAAKYTGDLSSADLGDDPLHAVVVQSTIPTGRILAVETNRAEAVDGVRCVVTHKNAPRLKPVKTLLSTELDRYLPLQDDLIRYNGQPIAIVVADTPDQARYAASTIDIKYEALLRAPLVSFSAGLPRAQEAKKVGAGELGRAKRGRPESAFASAAVQLERIYKSAAAHHNSIEPGATVAMWDSDGKLTVYNATQFTYGDAVALAEAFGFGAREKMLRVASQVAMGVQFGARLRVIAPFVGGGFGGKGSNSNLILTALVAKVAGRPVKLVLTREQTYPMMPYRSELVQHVRIGAGSDGKISAILHDSIVQSSTTASFVEPCGEMTPHLYACKHMRATHKLLRLDVNAPGWMRAPGACPGMFALECAMDEMAEGLSLDPVEFRLRNHAEIDPQSGHPWSSKSLKECYQIAGERIGWWSVRDPRVGSNRVGDLRIGFGMATAAYRTMQFPSTARITLLADGSALVQTAVHEIGQGGITALAQIAAEELGLPLSRIRLEWGDTALPFAVMTAASSTTLSVGSAIKAAADKLKLKISVLAVVDRRSPLYGRSSREVRFANGLVFPAGDKTRSEHFSAILERRARASLSAKGIAGRLFGKSRYARSAFGAQFAKVSVHSQTGEIRVEQLVGAFAGGRVINSVLARSQLLGGMTWGLGQALMEQSVLDDRIGRWMNPNLAEALVPTNVDVSQIEALLVEEDDSKGSSLGVKGLGEIGITGVAPAIANAVYHATGQRLRDLPLRFDQLLTRSHRS